MRESVPAGVRGYRLDDNRLARRQTRVHEDGQVGAGQLVCQFWSELEKLQEADAGPAPFGQAAHVSAPGRRRRAARLP